MPVTFPKHYGLSACKSKVIFFRADVVVEVVSPDDPARDTTLKRSDYAEAQIPEYWIVNPLDATVMVLTLTGEVYAEHGVFHQGERAVSKLLAGFNVSVDEVFNAM